MNGRALFHIVTLVALTHCDWDQRALLNSIPVAPDSKAHPALHVFLGVDGVSREALDEARLRGAFSDFSVSTLVPIFPATSDVSWTRILRAPSIKGYELTYYDAKRDLVENQGLSGLLGHAIPAATFDKNFPYYRAFEFRGTGYVDALEDYADPINAFTGALEELFSLLSARVGRADVSTGYLVEPDIAAHALNREVVVQMLVQLSQRITAFEDRHVGFNVTFTLVSDHGSDHTFKTIDVVPQSIAQHVGLTTVSSLAAVQQTTQPSAVTVEHSRTTYGVMHTLNEKAEAVATLVSRDEVVDLVVARALIPEQAPSATQWTAVYREGTRILRFGYDEVANTYWVERDGKAADLGLTLPSGTEPWVSVTDAEQFETTVAGPYPDLLFRTRTSLEPLRLRYPAQVIYSLKDTAVMRGILLPGSVALGSSGSHGALGGGGSRGVLLSQNQELPAYVRADDTLNFFPDVAAFVVHRLTH